MWITWTEHAYQRVCDIFVLIIEARSASTNIQI